MNKNKKIFSFAILAVSVATTLGAISTLNTYSFAAVKAECGHHQVNHYVGNSNRTYAGSEGEYVDHWICCGCHTVWADEARTIVLGNSQNDRSKVDLRNIQSYKFQWDYTGTPYYSEELGVYYKNTLLGSGGFNGNGGYYVETPNAPAIDSDIVDTITSVSFTLCNDTKFDLNVEPRDIEAGIIFGETINIPSGTSYTFAITAEQYNTKGKGEHQREYGFQLVISGTNTTITEKDTIRITTPKFITINDKATIAPKINAADYPSAGAWDQVPNNGTYNYGSYGTHCFEGHQNFPVHSKQSFYIDIINNEDYDTKLSFWGKFSEKLLIKAHSIKTYEISSEIWNTPNTSNDDKIYFIIENSDGSTYVGNNTCLEFYKCISSYNKKMQELFNAQLDYSNTETYIDSYFSNLNSIIEYYNSLSNLDAEITSHKNYLNSFPTTIFEKWDYGTSLNIKTEKLGNVDYAHVSDVKLHSDSNEFSISTGVISFKGSANYYVAKIYNPLPADVSLRIFPEYGNWGSWETFTLTKQSWNTIFITKNKLVEGKKLCYMFNCNGYENGATLEGTWKFSPIVDFISETSLASNPDNTTSEVSPYGISNVRYCDSLVTDPEWKCTVLTLDNCINVDQDKYNYVRFYLKNDTDDNFTTYLALKPNRQGGDSQYNFDLSGNFVPNGEWKEFRIPVEIWNKGTTHQIIFGGNGHHKGNITITGFQAILA